MNTENSRRNWWNSGGVAPSLFTAVAGHLAAGAVFWFSFRSPDLRSIWLAQFYVLLALSLALTLLTLKLRRQFFRIITLLNLLFIQIVIGYPEGSDLRVEAILGTVFIVVCMLEVQGPIAYILSFGYAIVLALNQWPITAWGISIPAPSLPAIVLVAIYLSFLTWLSGLVGSRGHRMRRQQADIDRLDRTVTALTDANLDFQEWGTRIQRETEVQERKRIAREIHDIVGYTLMNIQMMMEAATDLAGKDAERLDELLVKARDQAQRGLLETRRAMRNLRSVSAAYPSGIRRIQEVARIFGHATRLSVEFHIGNSPASFGAPIDDVLYRMVQECLTNSFRHGNASRITISFWVVSKTVRVTITDNGAGTKEVVPGIGLAGMTERLGQLGGTLTAESTRFGFRVFAEIPLDSEERREQIPRVTRG